MEKETDREERHRDEEIDRERGETQRWRQERQMEKDKRQRERRETQTWRQETHREERH